MRQQPGSNFRFKSFNEKWVKKIDGETASTIRNIEINDEFHLEEQNEN